MRIFGRDFRMFATAEPGEVTKPQQGEYGTEGESWYGSFASDEPPEWEFSERWRTIDAMRKGDSACKSVVWLTKLPLRSAEWDLEPVSDDPADVLVADYCRANLGLGGENEAGAMSDSWAASLEQALLYVPFGAMFEELIWGDPTEWRDADGDPHLFYPLARLAPRFPRTIDKVRWNARGEIEWVQQATYGAPKIPGDKLAYYVLDREGSDWRGTSILRAAFGPWLLKKQLMIAAGIGFDRWAAGFPVGRLPRDASDAETREMRETLRGVRLHERAWALMFGPPSGPGVEGSDLEILDGSKAIADPVPLIRTYSAQIAESALQQFSSLGTTETGSRAVGDTLAEPYYLALQATAEDIARARMRQVVRRIVEVNFGLRVPVPKLTVSKIQPENLERLGRYVGDLATAGITFTDREAQNRLRAPAGMGDLPEEPEALALDEQSLRNVLVLAGLPDNRIAEIMGALSEAGIGAALTARANGGAAREGDSVLS